MAPDKSCTVPRVYQGILANLQKSFHFFMTSENFPRFYDINPGKNIFTGVK